jgi:hypothetical protein
MMGQKRCTHAKAEFSASQAGRPATHGNGRAARIIGLLLVVLFAGNSAFADFFVQPMILRMTVQPGKRYTREMKLENSDPKEAETLTLRLAELTQKSDARWAEFQPDDPNFSKATVRSCSSWLTLPPGEIKVGGYQIVPFNLQIDVPAGTRGFFFAAIMATTAPRLVTLATGNVAPVNMVLVVPVILEVQSTPMPRNISLTDVGLKFQAPTGETPAANSATLDIANNGGTFSRLLPVVRLWGQSDGHWKKMGEIKFREITIMPGVKLSVRTNVGQALPSGDYQLEGFLFVDGQRGAVIRKVVKFEGDPTLAITMRGQASLSVEPSSLIVDNVIPGATRSMPIQVTNGSEEDVTVNAEVLLPDHMLSAVTPQGVKGDDLGCAGWVTVNPPTFTMKGHGRRSVVILTKMPKESGKYPSYYGTLRLHVSYADGKPAATKDSLICVQNKKVVGTPLLGATVLTVSESGPSRYLASASFSNLGETHVTALSCQGALSKVGAGGGGAAIVKWFQMSSEAYGQTGLLIPFESRSFSGALDVSNVEPGAYFVTSILKYAGGPADGIQKQITIEVNEQGGRKYARMVDLGNKTGGPQVIKL